MESTDQDLLRTDLGRLSPKELERYNELPKLRTWYGIRKPAKKAVRKKPICTIYENSTYWKNDQVPGRQRGHGGMNRKFPAWRREPARGGFSEEVYYFFDR